MRNVLNAICNMIGMLADFEPAAASRLKESRIFKGKRVIKDAKS